MRNFSMTSLDENLPGRWCLQDAKARFSELVRRARSDGPQHYRSRWKLLSDYPAVAPRYSQEQTRLAKVLGLGRKTEGIGALGPASNSRRRDAEKGRIRPRKERSFRAALKCNVFNQVPCRLGWSVPR
jgi:hypothetical protein